MLKSLSRRLLDVYKARKQRNVVLTVEHAVSVTQDLLKRTTYAFLVTRGEAEASSARLVQPIVDEEEAFVLWFGTSPRLRKVREIEADPRVTVAVESTRDNASLVLYGTAHVERDPAIRRRRWLGAWRMFFPDGPLGDDYVVLRFEAERIELMSFRRNVVPEPFGLRPLVLVREGRAWRLPEASPQSE